MKRKKKFAIITCTLFILTLLAFLLLYDHVHYDRSKENIFEIPKTAVFSKSGDHMRCDRYYFIQHVPKSQEEIKTLIKDHIEQNKVTEDAINSGAKYVALWFMTADFKLPIYFEENKSYFKMDDFITHYVNSNKIALYKYDLENDVQNITVYTE